MTKEEVRQEMVNLEPEFREADAICIFMRYLSSERPEVDVNYAIVVTGAASSAFRLPEKWLQPIVEEATI